MRLPDEDVEELYPIAVPLVDQENQLVVKTAVLERVLDEWPTAGQRQAYTTHSGTLWISESGLAFSRVTPLPPE